MWPDDQREKCPRAVHLSCFILVETARSGRCAPHCAPCVSGGRRLFVLVLVFAADHAEEREADQRCQKAQADQCGRGRRSRGEIKDGHYHHQREEDFQKFGHRMGGLLFRRACKTAPVHLLPCSLVGRATRFPVNLSIGSPVRRSTCLPIYPSTCSRGSHSSAHGGENHGQLFDHARAFEALTDDGQNGVVARDRAAEALGVVGVNFGRDASSHTPGRVRITTRLPENSMLRKPEVRRNSGVWSEGAIWRT